jgi:hypothetical protein
MSNHYHLVPYVDRDEAQNWDADEVIKRWRSLFKGSLLADRHLSGDKLSGVERLVLDQLVDQRCSRLTDISWFMRCLNEFIARKANQEDHCTGRYLEGRFKSQALLDEKSTRGLPGLCGSKSHPRQDCGNTGNLRLHFDLAAPFLPLSAR